MLLCLSFQEWLTINAGFSVSEPYHYTKELNTYIPRALRGGTVILKLNTYIPRALRGGTVILKRFITPLAYRPMIFHVSSV